MLCALSAAAGDALPSPAPGDHDRPHAERGEHVRARVALRITGAQGLSVDPRSCPRAREALPCPHPRRLVRAAAQHFGHGSPGVLSPAHVEPRQERESVPARAGLAGAFGGVLG